MSVYVEWTQSGLTDELVTVNYYEGNILNVTVEAERVTDDDGEVPQVVLAETLLVALQCDLSDLQYENQVKTATMKGEILDAFERSIGYLVDNPEPLQRTYGVASRIREIPEQKCMIYKYYKEQVAEKEIPVVARAYDPTTKQLVEEKQYTVTVINVWNDAAVLEAIIAAHAEWQVPYEGTTTV